MVVSSAGAILFSFVHYLIDWHIGLFGETSEDVSILQAALVFLSGLLYAAWAVMLGSAEAKRSHAAALLVFSGGWTFLGNGLVIFACLPPCEAGFPYQDIAHVGSLLFGG